MRVVLDTNVFISGVLLPKSIPGKIIAAWKNEAFDLIISEPLLQEIKKVLKYPKIQKRIEWSDKKISRFLFLIRLMSNELSNLTKIEEKNLRDKTDQFILQTFIIGNADYLVTGDNDLLEHKKKYPGIVSPIEFYQQEIM